MLIDSSACSSRSYIYPIPRRILLSLLHNNSPHFHHPSLPMAPGILYQPTPTQIAARREERECPNLVGQITRDGDFAFANGGFSDIFKGTWTQGPGITTQVALKFLRGVHTNSRELADIRRRIGRESKAWYNIDHPNVLKLFGICDDIKVGPSPCLVTPLCPEGSVKVFLDSHPGFNRLDIVKGIATAMEHLHSLGVCHGDLTPRNILMCRGGIPRVCDFGRSKIKDIEGFTASIHAGTVRYAAPEMMMDENEIDDEGEGETVQANGMTIPQPTTEADVYSFVMVMLEVLTGREPFCHIRLNTRIVTAVINENRPIRGRYKLKVPNSEDVPVPDHIWQILDGGWQHTPAARLRMREILVRLQ
ncbi:hypothetical protein JAAARDRAFT_271861 [Jaapia argillacea MUCL 33604]|uniref:Protein kinase domain-containing protein n=1 Tax=Jaapia argillacea MUCL 33604 TaxID=933084 RepID=A0A067Q508_9AGAM|nr:hypothetical protein JAAARDRAFT_271861 [Jaapia argillacea MUCL 33604]